VRRIALPVQQVGDHARKVQQPTRRQRDLAAPEPGRRDGRRAAVGPLDGQRQLLAHGTEDVNVAACVRADDPAE
jgi:hypothetical protein